MKYKPNLVDIAGIYVSGTSYRNDTVANTSSLAVARLSNSNVFTLTEEREEYDQKGRLISHTSELSITARFHAFLPCWSAYLLAIHNPKYQEYVLLRTKEKTWGYEGKQCLDFYEEAYASRKRGGKAILATHYVWILRNRSYSPYFRSVDNSSHFAELNDGLTDFFNAIGPEQAIARDYISLDGYNWKTTLPLNRASRRLNSSGHVLFLYSFKEELGGMPHELSRLCQEAAIYGLPEGALEVSICEDLDKLSGDVRMPEKLEIHFYSESGSKEVSSIKNIFSTCLGKYNWVLDE